MIADWICGRWVFLIRNPKSEIRNIPLCLGLALFSTTAACGDSPVDYALPAVEDEKTWEGIGYVGRAGDTAYIANIPGVVKNTPGMTAEIGGLRWTVVSIRDIGRGITRAWPSIDERWVGVDLRVESLVPSGTESGVIGSALTSETFGAVILRHQVVMIDNLGLRHHPMIVHDRLLPSIDDRIEVDSDGITTTLFFGIKREQSPAGIEIHAPLSSSRLDWLSPPAPGNWTPVNRKTLVEDQQGRAIWEIMLRRVRAEFGAGAETGTFYAEIMVRNVTRHDLAAPDPTRARLYAGSGRTYACVNEAYAATLGAGKLKTFTLRFDHVPRRESLELILPAGGGTEGAVGATGAVVATGATGAWGTMGATARMDAFPGYLPEQPRAMNRPAAIEGIRGTAYAIRMTDGSGRRDGFAARIGLLNSGAVDLDVRGITITGLAERTGGAVTGVMAGAPEVLYAGFEERRWVEFPTAVAAIRVEIPGRGPMVIKL